MYYEGDDEPYYEPSIADDILMEYIEKMKDALLVSVKYQLDNIKRDNENLKAENKVLKDMESKIRDRERSLENEKKNLMRTVRQEKLSTLMKDFEVIMYRADTIAVKSPKCNKCNVKREIEFISPQGNKIKETCACNTSKMVYEPEEHICTEFKVDRDDRTISAWYRINREGKDDEYYSYDSSNYAKMIYKDGLEFEKVETYHTYFKTKEECQKYCDWKNNTEEEKHE